MAGSNQRNGGFSRVTRERRGAMLAFAGVAMVALLGGVALVLDSGLGYRQRRMAQTAADAAAISGAHEILRERYDLVEGSATEEVVRNGFLATEIVSIARPPATGLFAGNGQYVEVIIGRNVPTLMSQLFGRSSWDIVARGVAGVSTSSFNCLYTLNPSGTTLLVGNGGSVSANCGAALNGSLQVQNGGDLEASGIAVTGSVNAGPSADISPTPSTGAVAPLNPLAALDSQIVNYVTARVPPIGTCTQTTRLVVSSDMTISPGVFCGGIEVTTGSHVLTMSPGIYIIAGGGLEVRTSGNISGTGVVIINTNGPVNDPALYAPFVFANGAKCDLTGPTSGKFAGMLLIQDPNAGVTGTTYTNTFACADDYALGGTIYLPTQKAYFQGANSKTAINGALIAYNVEVAPGAQLNINNPITSNSAVKRISLVE